MNWAFELWWFDKRGVEWCRRCLCCIKSNPISLTIKQQNYTANITKLVSNAKFYRENYNHTHNFHTFICKWTFFYFYCSMRLILTAAVLSNLHYLDIAKKISKMVHIIIYPLQYIKGYKAFLFIHHRNEYQMKGIVEMIIKIHNYWFLV